MGRLGFEIFYSLLVLQGDHRCRGDRRQAVPLFAVSKGMIDQLLFARLIETPETPFARFMFLASQTNEVSIETEVVSNGILAEEKTTPRKDRTPSTHLPTPIVRFVVGIQRRDEIIDLTQGHLFVRCGENRLHDQLSVGEGWFAAVLREVRLLLLVHALRTGRGVSVSEGIFTGLVFGTGGTG